MCGMVCAPLRGGCMRMALVCAWFLLVRFSLNFIYVYLYISNITQVVEDTKSMKGRYSLEKKRQSEAAERAVSAKARKNHTWCMQNHTFLHTGKWGGHMLLCGGCGGMRENICHIPKYMPIVPSNSNTISIMFHPSIMHVWRICACIHTRASAPRRSVQQEAVQQGGNGGHHRVRKIFG